MIQLERHIEILLLSNDCVIVPGLGGFMTHHVEAHYDEGDSLFLPPLRTLGFNPQLTMNDSLLAQSYVEAYDISYPEAVRRIEAEVSDLRQHVEIEGEYELNDIGVLRLNSEGRYEFSPCESGILTPSLYGLSSFEMPLLSSAVSEDVATHDETPLLVGEGEAESSATTAEHPSTLHKERAITIPLSWLRNTAAVAVAVILFFLLTTPIANSNLGQVQSSSIVPVTAHHDTTPATPAITTETVNKAIAKRDSADRMKAKEAQEATASIAPQHAYAIVLASQITRRNAEAFVTELHQKGFSKAEVYINNNIVRVTCGTFATQSEAYRALQPLRANDEFAEAWVLKI